ncbi:hypothetical protein F5883DRAFT_267460 [Diaporthe sp. PMI_573]|nr:hypothetical protein F5883DRAFT_267460 [Diaporthaceae sp. PMI_573]
MCIQAVIFIAELLVQLDSTGTLGIAIHIARGQRDFEEIERLLQGFTQKEPVHLRAACGDGSCLLFKIIGHRGTHRPK